jgi:Spy/CpxP family protein refolding chaperone
MKILNRKTLIAGVTAVVLAFSTAAFAQRGEGRRGPQKMLDRQMSVMKEQLKLTPEQETKVRAIFEESHRKTREAMRAAREETHSQLSQVLSAEQMEQVKTFQSKRGHRFRKGGDAPPKQ